MKNINLLFAAFCLLSASCVSRPEIRPEDKITVFIEGLRNSTVQPGLESELMPAMTDEILYDGHFVIAARDQAKMIISGEVTEFSHSPSAYSPTNEVEEYSMKINFRIDTVLDGESKSADFAGDTRYYSSLKTDGAFDAFREDSLKSAAITDCIGYISRQIPRKLTEIK